ncbi:membrane-associated protein [Deinococcus yavapaiensis KR-236]|uniref:Membrane-associated protein n=1 Tax=Deinococcus yavapaiensis KR-236 TaxID=694435 RepID=A0A318S6X4_9DEIO|nr:membrane-associated protein [Deinococcus yavapaiensis KR-236]
MLPFVLFVGSPPTFPPLEILGYTGRVNGSFLDPTYLIQTFSYVGLGAILFAETGLLAGFFLPGDTLLLTAGLFAARGDLHIVAVMLVCFVGAVVGNTVGYLLGRRFGPPLFSRPGSRFFKPDYVDLARGYFERYGVQTLLISRFVPIVRTFVPTMAGASGMNFASFTLLNVLGAVLWAGGVPLAGFLLGRVLPPHILDKYILVVVGVIFVASFVPVAVELFRRRGRIKL